MIKKKKKKKKKEEEDVHISGFSDCVTDYLTLRDRDCMTNVWRQTPREQNMSLR